MLDSDGSLIDVPVAVRNYEEDGIRPNTHSDVSDWHLTRRFFIFDTVSGIRETNDNSGFLNREVAEVVRYPKSITLRVDLATDSSTLTAREESITTPLLMIDYRERPARNIEEDPLARVSFTAEYAMDTDAFWSNEYGLFIVAIVLCIVVVLVRLYAFYNQGNLSDGDFSAACKYFVIRTIIDSIDVFS